MLLGAGSAASQGRQGRGLSAMTVHTRTRGMVWADSARCPEAVAPPCPQGNRALPPQPLRAQPRPRAGLPSLGHGARAAGMQNPWGLGEDGECNSQLRLHGRKQAGMQREQPSVPMNN